MRSSLRILVTLAMLLGTIAGTFGVAGGATEATYYLSVGDSVAFGEQPVGSNDKGYANQLYRDAREEITDLRLIKFGCPGDTTDSMITGVESLCRYPTGSQLNQAVAFLQAHPGQISFVTIDIGVNDALYACFDDEGVWHLACVENELPAIASNLAFIVESLEAAAPGVPIAGMSYYDPFLGYWIHGHQGKRLARIDQRTLQTLNAGLVSTYRSEGVLVADVGGPDFFDTANFTDRVWTEEWGTIPVNVAHACGGTWFCTPCPDCPDVHPNTAGYGVIAEAFEEALGL
jgi:lysophospholipase L1-like esterase